MNSIFHRISVRKYEDKPVEKEKIMEILKAGMQAPSACNQQPWEFYVVTDKEKIQKLSKVTPSTGCVVGVFVVFVSKKQKNSSTYPKKKQTGNRYSWSGWSMVWHCSGRRTHGKSSQTSGSSGKCKSLFHVCTGLSGRNKTSAGSVLSRQNSLYRKIK